MTQVGGDDLDDFIIDDYAISSGEEELQEIDDLPNDTYHGEAEPGVPLHTEIPKDDEKKRKRKEKMKERKAKRRKLVEETDNDDLHSVTAKSPSELTEYLAVMSRKTFSKLSELELEDLRIPEASIADTTAWTGPKTLDQLSSFIVKVLPALHIRLSQRSKSNGSPTLIFVTGAALRVADVTRILKNKQLRGEKGGEVAKLFAKHFKLSEHVAYLKRTKVGAAVGTPGRLGKLLCDTDALGTSALTHIILDITYRDAKKRSLLDIPETRDEVFKTVLGCPTIQQGVKSGKIQVVLF